MRLIDADDAIRKMESTMDMQDLYLPIHFKEVIDEVPTVEERKKGKWNCEDDMFEYAVCSSCKWDSGEAWEYAKKYFRYCPNCGADMRGEKDG